MAGSACTGCAKFLLIFTGVFYLASAAGLSYIGIWVFSTYDHFDEIADSALTLLPASIILGVSVFMCAIGILACLAAFKSNKLLLAIFFSLILVVLVGELLAGALGYVYRSKVEKVLDDDLMDAINKYDVKNYKEQIDYMHEQFECCGVHNSSDWKEAGKPVPFSCCRQNLPANVTCDPQINADIYTEGCVMKLKDEFRSNLIYIAGSVVMMAIVQILALMSTCILVCRTRKLSNYQQLGEQVGGGLRI